MSQVSQVLVGAEYIVESGGILNKIGTYNIALTAKQFNIPFYVVAESLKFLEYYPIDQLISPDIKVGGDVLML
jgi:translation initiation factor eIF-2B subunit alpha